MKRRLPIGEAKAGFAECVRRAESGETIILTRHGRPVARLTGLGLRSESEAGSARDVRESESAYGLPQPLGSAPESRREALERLLRDQIWPRVPEDLLDRGIDKAEREEILGYGSGGV